MTYIFLLIIHSKSWSVTRSTKRTGNSYSMAGECSHQYQTAETRGRKHSISIVLKYTLHRSIWIERQNIKYVHWTASQWVKFQTTSAISMCCQNFTVWEEVLYSIRILSCSSWCLSAFSDPTNPMIQDSQFNTPLNSGKVPFPNNIPAQGSSTHKQEEKTVVNKLQAKSGIILL